MMTSRQIRQSFLDFFRSKQHTIVHSSSLMPDSPNLLFTNAGMNQFVPIFLGERTADVDKWAGAVPSLATRAADTQKCIRAGGKHNDLDDVGLDTYHHTFFEMLGNWSFGDYFKRDAIDWAWELVTGVWNFPKDRIYATVYNPDKSKGDPSEFDQEAWNFWAEKFRAAGLDPAVHIVNGNKKDNFWMMGETGPCGPCSELHVDLTPTGDTKGALVNKGTAECIEIWNLVFIQYNANQDGTFSPLPAQHVDTGMGFERVTSIIQGTKAFTDFQNAKISNYETDIFRPIFDEIEKLSGKRYGSTLPKSGSTGDTEQEKIDVAFRVIADHIRTLSFSIADGIEPGNGERNYVLRRILRRAVNYGRTLGFHGPFFYKLVDILARSMGEIFPEVLTRQQQIEKVLLREEISFNRTLDEGTRLFYKFLEDDTDARRRARIALDWIPHASKLVDLLRKNPEAAIERLPDLQRQANSILANLSRDYSNPQSPITTLQSVRTNPIAEVLSAWIDLNNLILLSSVLDEGYKSLIAQFDEIARRTKKQLVAIIENPISINGWAAFKLYDTYGFPVDLTQLLARERGLSVDKIEFDLLMDEQKARSQAAQKRQVIELSQIETKTQTHFLGYDHDHVGADVQEVVALKDKTVVVLNSSVCYAEMGGQVGDTAELTGAGQLWRVVNTQKSGNTWLHFLEGTEAPSVGQHVTLRLDAGRRAAIQRHHTVTHLLHWALHEVVSKDATQKGSSVGPDKLTFDFNHGALTVQQIADIERLVNERIVENGTVSWIELPYVEVKPRTDVMQFFGDKYGDVVRVVQIGGHAQKLDGYSMELCGGTHTRATGEIGLFRIAAESAISAGVRRIEAVAGLCAYDLAREQNDLIKTLAGKVNAPLAELEKRIEALLAHQKELEKSLKAAAQREASQTAKQLLTKVEILNGVPTLIANVSGADGDTLQTIADAIKGEFPGVIILAGASNGAVSIIAAVAPSLTSKYQAGKLIQAIAPIVGGKGGGKPDNARGGGKDPSKIDEALAKARSLI